MKRKTTKLSGFRKLVIDGQVWGFRVGSGTAVLAGPDGKKRSVNLPDLTGSSHASIANGRWKGTDDGSVTPGMVVAYIRANLMRETA